MTFQHGLKKTVYKMEGGFIMPHIAITMIPGRNDEIKKALALKVQNLLVAELGIEPKFVSVSIQDIPMEEWADSMEQFSDDIMFVKPGI